MATFSPITQFHRPPAVYKAGALPIALTIHTGQAEIIHSVSTNKTHMNKLILTTVLATAALFAVAQKIEVKKNQVLADKKPYLLFEKDGCKALDVENCTYYISDTSGNREIAVNYRTYEDPLKRSELNKSGIVNYYEVIFLKSKQMAEIPSEGFRSEKALMTKLVKGRLFANGTLNNAAVDEFVLVNGTTFSNRRANIFR